MFIFMDCYTNKIYSLRVYITYTQYYKTIYFKQTIFTRNTQSKTFIIYTYFRRGSFKSCLCKESWTTDQFSL